MSHPRVGIGYDLHRLRDVPGASLVLAGVAIPCHHEAVAHSDGDVVLHAVADALLGAVAAGDLGEHFPPDLRNADRPSCEIVAEILALPALAGWRVAQVDVNVIAETPRLGAHKRAMRRRLADLLSLPLDACSIKARSQEGCDAIGRKEAIAAQAVVVLVPADPAEAVGRSTPMR